MAVSFYRIITLHTIVIKYLFYQTLIYKCTLGNCALHFRTHSALNGRAPKNILEQKALPSKYRFTSADIELINTKLKKMQKMFPLFQHVLLKTKKEDFYKKSVYNLWSNTVYAVDGFKRPAFSKEQS